MGFDLDDVEREYSLELDRVLNEIKKVSAKSVLLQLPDGLKPYGSAIVDYLSEKSGVEVRIFLGDCFGACDVPDSDCDLLVQFGHACWE